jgi:hypothetical protein
MYRSLLILFSLFLFSQCEQVILEQEEVEESSELGGNINSELAPFFITFQEEARRYGLEIDYESSNVTAQLEQINNGNVAGTCTTNGHNLRDIVIDQSFWDRASPLLREMVIFHELGHCVLGRGHFEGQFNNGVCQSIMRSGLGSCIDAYNANNRDYFIDELFLESD